MSPSPAGETRPSRRQIKKSWITGSVVLGVIVTSSGAAMATMRTSDHPDKPSSASNADLCLHLDHEALMKIHMAEYQAWPEGGGTADVRLPADVVYNCPDSTTPTEEPPAPPTDEPPAPPTEEPPAPPTEEPPAPPTEEPPAPPTQKPPAPPTEKPPAPPTQKPPAPPTQKPPAPTVSSTAS